MYPPSSLVPAAGRAEKPRALADRQNARGGRAESLFTAGVSGYAPGNRARVVSSLNRFLLLRLAGCRGTATRGGVRQVVSLVRYAVRNENFVLVAQSHNGLGAPKARPTGAERGLGVPASDGVRGSGGRSPPV